MISHNTDYILYGTGNYGHQVESVILGTGGSIKLWLDKDPGKVGTVISGAKVYSPVDFPDEDATEIIVCVSNAYSSIRELLIGQGISSGRIIPYEQFLFHMEMETLGQKAGSQQEKKSFCLGEDVLLCMPAGFKVGGIESFNIYLYRRLKSLGISAKFLVFRETLPIPDDLKTDVIELPKGSFHQNVQTAYAAILEDLPRTIVISCFDELAIASCMAKKTLNSVIRLVSVLHSDFEDIYRSNDLFSPYVTAYAGVSNVIVDKLHNTGIPLERITSVTLPIPVADELVRSYHVNPEETLRLGFAGRLEKRSKRLDWQFELIKKMADAHMNFDYSFIGTGSWEQKIQTFIEENSLQKQVHLLPPVSREHIHEFWENIDVCISTSDREGRGISILEAMANGAVPVVTATAGAYQDISDGESGFISEIGDIDDMFSNVKCLYGHRDELPLMGRKAYEKIKTGNDVEAFDQIFLGLVTGHE